MPLPGVLPPSTLMLMVPPAAAVGLLPPPLGVTPALPPCALGPEPDAGAAPAEHAATAETATPAANDLRKADERLTRTSGARVDERDAVHMMRNREANDHPGAHRKKATMYVQVRIPPARGHLRTASRLPSSVDAAPALRSVYVDGGRFEPLDLSSFQSRESVSSLNPFRKRHAACISPRQ